MKEDSIDDCLTDIMMCSRGIVYKDKDSNIHVREWNSTDSTIVYDVKENVGEIVNYGTVVGDVIYGFIESENSCRLVRINWTGECSSIEDINGIAKAVELGLSVNNGVRSYWKDGKCEFSIIESN